SAFEGTVEIIPSAQNFYDLDLVELEPAEDRDKAEEVELNLESGEQRETTPAQGLDDMLKPDLEASKPIVAVPLELKENTTIESSSGVMTARREKRVADAAPAVRRTGGPPGEINLSAPPQLEPAHALGPTTLRDYLRGNLLGGPATITLFGAP